MSSLAKKLLAIGLVGLALLANPVTAATPNQLLLEQLKIAQGRGEFVQKKYFKFLSKPIKSTGVFAVNQQAALWQTQTPVFSQVLLADSIIYRRLKPDDSYQIMVQDSDISSVMAAIFKAEISAQDWSVIDSDSANCVALTPNNHKLQQAFSQISLCLLDDGKRLITLRNKQNTKTEIELSLISEQLSSQELDSLEPAR